MIEKFHTITEFCYQVLAMLFSREEQSNLPSSHPRRTTKANSTSQVKTKNENRVLVLVVNGKNKNLFNSIKDEKHISSENCQLLYRSTQGLWLAELSQFSASNLEKNFSSLYTVSEENESEYDVYFVVIGLQAGEPGFEANASSIERLDAFEKLPEIATAVKVSPRLHCSAYELPYFYGR